MAAKRLPGLYPEIDKKESLDITKIYSAAGLLSDGSESIVKQHVLEAVQHRRYGEEEVFWSYG